MKAIEMIKHVKELESQMQDLLDTMSKLRNSRKEDVLSDSMKDPRYSIQLMVHEYYKLKGELDRVLNTDIMSIGGKVDA